MFTRAAIWMRLDPRYIAVFLWSALIVFIFGDSGEINWHTISSVLATVILLFNSLCKFANISLDFNGVCGSRNSRRIGRRATDVKNGNAGPKLHWRLWG